MKQFVMQNLFIVIAVAVAVVALAFVVVPILQVSQANAGGAELEKLYSRVSGAYKSAESPKWVVESDAGIDKIREIQERVIVQSLQFSTRPPLLVSGRLALPNPDFTDRLEFTGFYRDSFEGWLKEMKAGRLPTGAELAPIIDQKKASMLALGGAPTEERTLPEEARIQETARRASICNIWAEPSCFDYYLKTVGVRVEDRQMWEAQLNWWVQRDLVEVIKAVNSEPIPDPATPDHKPKAPANVLAAPIKEWVWTDVNEQYYKVPAETDTLTSASEGAVPGILTGHTTCPKYDIIHLSFQVVMDPKNLPQLVAAMSSKNFYTLLAVNYATLDRKGVKDVFAATPGAASAAPPPTPGPVPGPGQESIANVSDYGPDPVMVVSLKFEALFMKSPASWRDSSDAARTKRLDFFRGNPKLVLEVQKESGGDKREVLLTQAPLKNPAGQETQVAIGTAEGQKKLGAFLKAAKEDVKDEQKLRFIGLYEDLIPGMIKGELPGFAGSSPAGKGK